MGVAEIKQQIKRHEASIEAKQQTFIAQREQIIAAIKPFVREQLKKEVETAVKRNSEHTKELGKEALSEMKKRLTELLENSDCIVDKTFSDDALWTYVDYNLSPNGDRYGQGYNQQKRAIENIEKGLRVLIGQAGRILLDYKYITIGGQYRWDNDMRGDYSHPEKGCSKIIYGYGLPVPQSIRILMDEYCNGIKELHESVSSVLDLQRKLSEQEAVDLWEEV